MGKYIIMNGYWNGEPAKFTPCMVRVVKNEEMPMAWYNAFDGQVVQALRMTQHGYEWLIYNGDGSGIEKVTTGMGSPSYGHKSLPSYLQIVDIGDDFELVTHFRADVYQRDEEAIARYQQETDMDEYNRILSLRAKIKSFQTASNSDRMHIINKMMQAASSVIPEPNKKK